MMLRGKIKVGAMFGLDARIALAIFGALSVIGAAALYSALEKSKATAVIVELNEVGKAWNQFYLDTGISFIPLELGSSNYRFYMNKDENFIRNADSLSGWKGPYLSNDLELNNGYYFLSNAKYLRTYVLRLSESASWGGSNLWHLSGGFCSSGLNCYIWIVIDGIDSLSLVKRVDELVDGVNDPNSGSLKWTDNPAYPDARYALFFKISPIKNPND